MGPGRATPVPAKCPQRSPGVSEPFPEQREALTGTLEVTNAHFGMAAIAVRAVPTPPLPGVWKETRLGREIRRKRSLRWPGDSSGTGKIKALAAPDLLERERGFSAIIVQNEEIKPIHSPGHRERPQRCVPSA